MALELRNAHSILAALQARPADVWQLTLPRERRSDVWVAIAALAEELGVSTEVVAEAAAGSPAGGPPGGLGGGSRPTERRRNRGRAGSSGPKQGREGAAHAVLGERKPEALRAVLGRADVADAGGGDAADGGVVPGGWGVWLALDSIQDPRNVGAIFRSAAFFGVRGVVMGEDRSAALTSVTYDTASGGLETVPFAVETNLRRTLEVAKDVGLWVLGTADGAADSIAEVPRDRDWLVVVGNEERGLRRLTLEACDAICAIGAGGASGEALSGEALSGEAGPGDGRAGAPTSLNVSVATGILLAMLARPLA